MPIYDARCTECEHLFEERRKSGDQPSRCPKCGHRAKLVWTSVPILEKAKDPYDYLDGYVPEPKKVKSFATDHRRGGKDTT